MTEQDPKLKISDKSLDAKSSRDLLYRQVAEATQLREGPEGVEQFLRVLILKKPSAIKSLAQQLGWPIPLSAAVRRELEKRGILDRKAGLCLSEKGMDLMNVYEQVSSDVETCSYCLGSGWKVNEPLSSELLPQIEMLVQKRPEVDVTLDQALATPETNLRRALLLISALTPDKQEIVFLGDDDWTSASLALAIKVLYDRQSTGNRIRVIDIDSRIVNALNQWASQEAAPLEAILHDLRKPSNAISFHSADAVFTDPPYTEKGLDLFCGWARQLLRKESGNLFLCYPKRDPRTHFRIEEIWHRWGFSLVDHYKGWNQYEGNSLHAGQSDLWRLKIAAPLTIETIPVGEDQSIYTYHQKSRKIRTYQCQECKKEILVGENREWPTIEILKKSGCPGCKGKKFNLF